MDEEFWALQKRRRDGTRGWEWVEGFGAGLTRELAIDVLAHQSQRKSARTMEYRAVRMRVVEEVTP